jgi:hypothetical protein
MKKRTEEFTFEVPNWAKYNPRNDYRSMPWIRLQTSFFDDPRITRLSTLAAHLYLYLLTVKAQTSDAQATCIVRFAALKTHSRTDRVIASTNELEQNQLITIVSRSWDVRGTFATKRNETNERDERNDSKGVLTNLHRPAKINSQPQKSKQKTESKTAATWESFSNAYRKRYGSDPVRNATTNSQMSNFVKRIGETESPEVAAYYLTLNEQFYTNGGHSTGLLLRDCEKIRTLWATGRRTTAVDQKTVYYQEQMRAIEQGEI